MARQSRAPTILLTRPLRQGQRFAAQLHARCPEVEVMLSPLMAPEFRAPVVPEADFEAVILASEAGVEAARRISASGASLPKRAFCVGSQTASAANAAGFDVLAIGADANALVDHMLATPPAGQMMFLRGQDSAGHIAERLHSAGIETFSAIVYAQIPQPLSAEAQALLRQSAPVIIPLFSPVSAGHFVAEAQKIAATAPLWLASFSPAVTVVAATIGLARTATASQPNAEAMMDAIADLLTHPIGS